MMRVKLKDITNYSKGSQINRDILLENGKYIYLNGGINPSGKWNAYNVSSKTITISEGGNSSGYINYITEPFWCGAHCYYLFDGPKNTKYLYYALKSQQERLFKIRSGACMPNIKKKDLGNFEFEFDFNEKIQIKIVSILDECNKIINNYKLELELLDELVKARFVELFGTLDNPTFNYNKSTLGELCYKITDGKHGGCSLIQGSNRYLVGAREIYDDKVHYENAPEISVDDFEKDYRRCNVEVGDFLIVNTGATIGKSAIATDQRTKHTLLQKSVALLKLNQDLLNPEFLKWCYRINTRMYLVESSSAQPNLLLSKIKATEIYVPPIELQNQFADFVKEVDKSRLEVQKSLKKTQELFDSLMQKYFG